MHLFTMYLFMCMYSLLCLKATITFRYTHVLQVGLEMYSDRISYDYHEKAYC